MLEWHCILLVCLFSRSSRCVTSLACDLLCIPDQLKLVGKPPASASWDCTPPYLTDAMFPDDTLPWWVSLIASHILRHVWEGISQGGWHAGEQPWRKTGCDRGQHHLMCWGPRWNERETRGGPVSTDIVFLFFLAACDRTCFAPPCHTFLPHHHRLKPQKQWTNSPSLKLFHLRILKLSF